MQSDIMKLSFAQTPTKLPDIEPSSNNGTEPRFTAEPVQTPEI